MLSTVIFSNAQLLALVTCPELMEDSKVPEDVKEKALNILRQCRGRSIGKCSKPKI